MSFADIVKQERERLGITQAQAASLLGVSKSVIEKWEAGTRTPLEITQEGALARLVLGHHGAMQPVDLVPQVGSRILHPELNRYGGGSCCAASEMKLESLSRLPSPAC